MVNRSFDLFGTKYRVKFVDVIPVAGDGVFRWGTCDSARKTITVATKDPDGKDLSIDEIMLTFYHELFHSVLDEGQYGGSNDEPLVEWLAKCLRSLIKQKVISI